MSKCNSHFIFVGMAARHYKNLKQVSKVLSALKKRQVMLQNKICNAKEVSVNVDEPEHIKNPSHITFVLGVNHYSKHFHHAK